MPPFYKLTLPEVIELSNRLRYSDFKVLLYLKTSAPFCTGPLDVDCQAIASDLGLDLRTVSRCLKRLEAMELVGEVVIGRASITILPWRSLATGQGAKSGSGDPQSGSGDPQSGSGDPQSGSGDPLSPPETLINRPSQLPLDQIDLKRSSDQGEEEEEPSRKAFKNLAPEYRAFLQKKAEKLPERPNNLTGWIVAMADKGVYLSEFESLQKTSNVSPVAPLDKNFSSPAEYWRWINSRQGNETTS